MSVITPSIIRQHIQETLYGFFERKFKSDLLTLKKVTEQGDLNKVAELTENLNNEKQKYKLDHWIENELPKMLKGLKFGTHISKGIHSSSKGDNVFFEPRIDLSDSLIVGTHTLPELTIDANGNAAALPLAAFLETPIADTTLQELIISDSEALVGVFHKEIEKSLEIQHAIKEVLVYIPDTPFSDDRNKHILWPLGENAIDEDSYANLIPLHPSSLVKNVFKTIQEIRFDEEISKAKESRRKNQPPYSNYPIILNLAVVNLGGANAQNVSRFTAQQGGKNYLLPSFPPNLSQNKDIPLKPLDSSIFNNRLKYSCRHAFNTLKDISKLNVNNQRIRSIREDALDEILITILSIAENIKKNWLPGWSEEYSLNNHEKNWLDPEAFSDEVESLDWAEKVSQHFAQWLNQWLQREVKKLKDDFSLNEYLYLKEEMHGLLKAKHKGY